MIVISFRDPSFSVRVASLILKNIVNIKIKKYPSSLSQNGMLNTCVNLQLMPISVSGEVIQNRVSLVNFYIVDCASLVNSNQPRYCWSYDDLTNSFVIQYTLSLAQNHQKVYIFFDVYQHDSLKGETRRHRGKRSRRKVDHQNFELVCFVWWKQNRAFRFRSRQDNIKYCNSCCSSYNKGRKCYM